VVAWTQNFVPVKAVHVEYGKRPLPSLSAEKFFSKQEHTEVGFQLASNQSVVLAQETPGNIPDYQNKT
jgi:hypothetical protein